jgi:hypothetical protein
LHFLDGFGRHERDRDRSNDFAVLIEQLALRVLRYADNEEKDKEESVSTQKSSEGDWWLLIRALGEEVEKGKGRKIKCNNVSILRCVFFLHRKKTDNRFRSRRISKTA